jgi:UDP-N-acetylmuramyl tripeptide synthase
MTLRELLHAAGIAAPPDAEAVPVTGLAYRSESVTPGALFFCVPGFVVDGHAFAPDAVQRGAAALVCERPLGTEVPEVVVPSVRRWGRSRPRSTATRRRSSAWPG